MFTNKEKIDKIIIHSLIFKSLRRIGIELLFSTDKGHFQRNKKQ